MIYNVNKEELRNNLSKYNNSNVRLVLIDCKVRNVDELMRKLYEELEFPDYFGYNWNALNDCLQDFSWLKEDYVFFIIINKNYLLLDEKNQKELFFKCLELASNFWDDTNDEFGYKDLHPNMVFNVYYVDI